MSLEKKKITKTENSTGNSEPIVFLPVPAMPSLSLCLCLCSKNQKWTLICL